MQAEKHSNTELALLCAVSDRDRRGKVEEILNRHETFFILAAYGRGTASSKVLSYLGLGETEKAVFFSVMRREAARAALERLDAGLQMEKPGHGITFLTAVEEGCYRRTVEFTDGSGNEMAAQTPHSLILVVLNRGYSEEVMEAARAAGATGGTVLHARSLGQAGMEKFFGVTIAPEKELLMILAGAEDACGIMAGIARKNGPESDSGAFSFSLPVSAARGIRGAPPLK